MKEQNYDLIKSFEKENWWYKSKRALIKRILKSQNKKFNNFLDLGCGVGSNFEILKEFSEKVVGVDNSKKSLEYSKEKEYSSLKLMNSEKLKFKSGSFDLVLCSDVLEHVDDTKTIKEIARVLKPEGILVFSVPAHNYLWGPTDIISDHKRRYEKSEIASLLEGNFNILKINYWNFTMFLPNLILIKVLKLLNKDKNPENTLNFAPKILNNLFYFILSVENKLFFKLNFIQGVSVVGICQKK